MNNLKLRLRFIQQFLQGGTRSRIANNPLPFRVPIQFRHQGGQVLRQPLPVLGRERPDGRFDFLNRARGERLLRRPNADKLAVPPGFPTTNLIPTNWAKRALVTTPPLL